MEVGDRIILASEYYWLGEPTLDDDPPIGTVGIIQQVDPMGTSYPRHYDVQWQGRDARYGVDAQSIKPFVPPPADLTDLEEVARWLDT